jgi:hypothetical protein
MSDSDLSKKKPATPSEVFGKGSKRGVQEAIQEAIKEGSLSPEEAAELDNLPLPVEEDPEEPGSGLETHDAMTPGTGPSPMSKHEPPEWVLIPPPPFKLPRRRVLSFLRFRAIWTDTPEKGDRQCILWNLTATDERFALQRSRGDGLRTITEYAKQMVRAIDGVVVNRSGTGAGNVDAWWNEVGAKCRQLIINHYLRTHTLNTDERKDFFSNCVAVRTVGALPDRGTIRRIPMTSTTWTTPSPSCSLCTTHLIRGLSAHGILDWTWTPRRWKRLGSTRWRTSDDMAASQ